jgi:DeoR family fructose operon transcriptional repressor
VYEEERHQKILELIREQSRVDLHELTDMLNVSESTIRRDLKVLEEKQLLKRTHGGAISLQTVTFEPTVREKEMLHQPSKQAIARKAVEFISDGDTILLDSGTTVHCLVKELKAFNQLTIVTNAISYAHEFYQQSGIEVIFLGGSLRKGTLSLVGSLTEMCLNRIHVDKAFIATNGIDLREGLTTPNITEADIKRKMIECSKQTYLLADSSKAGIISFAKFARLEDIDVFITDSQMPEHFIKGMKDRGVEVYA